MLRRVPDTQLNHTVHTHPHIQNDSLHHPHTPEHSGVLSASSWPSPGIICTPSGAQPNISRAVAGLLDCAHENPQNTESMDTRKATVTPARSHRMHIKKDVATCQTATGLQCAPQAGPLHSGTGRLPGTPSQPVKLAAPAGYRPQAGRYFFATAPAHPLTPRQCSAIAAMAVPTSPADCAPQKHQPKRPPGGTTPHIYPVVLVQVAPHAIHVALCYLYSNA